MSLRRIFFDNAYKRLKQAEGEILEGLQATYPQVIKVTDTNRIIDDFKMQRIQIGASICVFRGELGQGHRKSV